MKNMSATNKHAAPVVVERSFGAPVERVWKAITSRDEMKQWYFDLKEFRAEVGFQFAFDVEHEGVVYAHRCKVMEVVPFKKIAYTWCYEGYEGDSLVSWELFAEGQKTRLKLTHTGLDTFPKIPAFAPKNFVQGWTSIIGTSLMKFVETE